MDGKKTSFVDKLFYGESGERAVPFSEVLHEEVREISCKPGRQHRGHVRKAVFAEPPPKNLSAEAQDQRSFQEALDEHLTGLAFSGGGIRSATFNLGIIQALADLKLLRTFDYLSTVSGGGYIGSWLSALIHRENLAAEERDEPPRGVEAAEARLTTQRNSTQAHEDEAITFLRKYSNYLTPQIGLFSADTWALITTYVRNLLLNLIILIAGLGAILLLPRLISPLRQLGEGTLWGPALLSIAIAQVAMWFIGYNMASFPPPEPVGKVKPGRPAAGKASGATPAPLLTQASVQQLVVMPLLLAGMVACIWLPPLAGQGSDLFGLGTSWAVSLSWALLTGLAYGGSWALAWIAAHFSRWGAIDTGKWTTFVLTGVGAGAVGGLLLQGLSYLLSGYHRWIILLWGMPLLAVWFYLIAVVQTGLMGRDLPDRQREWLSRVGAWLLIYALTWVALVAVTVYGPVLIYAVGGLAQGGLIGGWILTTLGGLLASRGSAEGGIGTKLRRFLAAAAPYVFIVGLAALLAVGLDRGLSMLTTDKEPWNQFQEARQTWIAEWKLWDKAAEGDKPERPSIRDLWGEHIALLEATDEPKPVLLLWIVLAAIALLQALRVDINEFSMHRFYRNRLVRCYLGASVPSRERERRQQPFTSFHHGDDIKLANLKSDRPLPLPGPLHLVNTALNLVGGEELAWQQRKASSFVLSPLFCGFETTVREKDTGDDVIASYGYRPSRYYGNHPLPLTLGSAFAISGAAASPNMGFRTTPAYAFLLTVFNVRLGWWLGNPRHEISWRRSGPVSALLHILKEILGKTNSRTRYVYLSDGGHFDNLGIYELVRRRCRFIVACDAGADPELRFDDLGNAIRKCRADFGIEIKIDLDPIRRASANATSQWHCAIGNILYHREDQEPEVGTLVYIKASLTGDEPQDILNYGRENPAFPHQPTGDQWFDESQFESYRRLGVHIGWTVLGRAAAEAESEGHFNLETFFRLLREQWHPPTTVTERSFTHHTETLDAIMTRIADTPALAFLDGQIYPEWGRLVADVPPQVDTLWLPKKDAEKREGFYICTSLIQLMENVYLDLHLEDQYDHPDNRGWLNLFKHFSWSGMFRATWAISASTYGNRFQRFCSEHLDLELGDVVVTPFPLAAEKGDDKGISGEAVKAAFDDPDNGRFFNFYERRQIVDFLALDGNRGVDRILQLELVVRGIAGAEGEVAPDLLRFPFGYALLAGDAIVLFRVQDHLRKMGLARCAVYQILKNFPPQQRRTLEPKRGTIPRAFEDEFNSLSQKSFYDLFWSVWREVESDTARSYTAQDDTAQDDTALSTPQSDTPQAPD